LLEPIGMTNSDWTVDRAGNALTFMGLQSTCRDLARFGVLVLEEGEWNGEQIISSEYLEEATSISQDLNSAYGFLFWLNARGTQASSTSPLEGDEPDEADADVEDGQMVGDRPERLIWALGLAGQVVQMDPGTDTVVVRIGSESDEGRHHSYGPHQSAVVLDGIDSDDGGD